MKNLFTLSAIASTLVLVGCGGSGDTETVLEAESRLVTIGFNVTADETDMDGAAPTPTAAPTKQTMSRTLTTSAAPAPTVLERLDASDFAYRDGYILTVNGEQMLGLAGMDTNGTFSIDESFTLTLEVRDDYKVVVLHPELSEQIKADFSENYSLYGEHVMGADETESIVINMDNTSFSFVTLTDALVVANAELNTKDFVNIDKREDVHYGFVSGDTYTLMINSQYGMNTYEKTAEVGKHYHWAIDEATGSFDPDFNWGEGNMDGTALTFKSSNLNLLVGVDGSIQGTVVEDALAQLYMQEVPGTSVEDLNLNISVNTVGETPTEWGYTNIYLEENGTLYCATIENTKVRLQQAWGCGYNDASFVAEYDNYAAFQASTYNNLVLREEADFGTMSNIFHRMNPAKAGDVVSIVFESEVSIAPLNN